MSVLLPNGMMIQEPSSVKFVKVVVDSRGQSELFIVVVKLGDDSEMPVDYCEDEQSALRLSEQCTDIINGTVDWEESLPSETSSEGKPEAVRAVQGTPSSTSSQVSRSSGTQAGSENDGRPAVTKKSAPVKGKQAQAADGEEESWDDWGDATPSVEAGQADDVIDLKPGITEGSEPEVEDPPYIPTPVDEDSDEWPFDNGKDDWY